jgi:peroxiredoxin
MKKNIKNLLFAFILIFFISTNISIYSMDLTPNLNKKFIDFKLPSHNDENINTEILRKNKILVIKFGTTWCPPCSMQTDHFKDLFNELDNNQVVFLEVFVGEGKELALNYVNEKNIKHHTVYDKSGSVGSIYKVQFVPKTMIVSKDGIITYEGAMTPKDILKEEIENAKNPENKNIFKDFSLLDIDGNSVDTKTLRENRVFLVKFGATWCPPCNKMIPNLKEVQNRFQDKDFAMLDVNSKEELSTIKQHIKDHNITYTVAVDNSNIVFQKFGIKYIPKVILVDKNGKIVLDSGYIEASDLIKEIEKLLK